MAQANPWEMDWSQPADVVPPTFPGVIPGRPKAPDAAEQERLRMEQERLRIAQDAAARDAAKDSREAQQDADKLAKVDNAQFRAAEQLRTVIDKIDQVAFDSADNAGWFETGRSGAFVRSMPTFVQAGTAAYDLAGNIKTIDANAAFNALAEMRNNSPTGGALGQVTEKELDLLKSSIANLDPNLSQGTFLTNLAEAKRVYLDMLNRIDPGAAASYRDKPGLRFNEDGSVNLVSAQGEDRREPIDPLGVMENTHPSGGGGGSGRYSLNNIATALAQGTGSIAEGAGDLIGIAANPVGQLMYDALGVNQRYDAGTVLREVAGLPVNPNRLNDAVIKGATGALTGSALARGVAAVTRPGVAQGVLSTIGRTPIRDAAAGAGAGAGALAGQQSNIPGGEIVGALAGGLAGYAGANAALRAGAPRVPSAVADAARRQDVELMPADVGGRGSKVVTSAARSSPFSADTVSAAAERTQSQLGSAIRRVAGEEVDTDVAGEIIRGAAQRYTKQTAQRGSRMYDRAYQLSKGVRVKPLQTLNAIDEQIARLEQNPAAGGMLNELRTLRSSIEGGVTVQGLRDARTALSQGVYDGKLRSSSDAAVMKGILGNVAEDIDAGLRQAGRGRAADLFRTADKFWSERVEHIDSVLQPIIGRDGQKGGEQIVEAIESMARGKNGGNQRLSRLLSNMTDNEAVQVRSSIVSRLGRANAGAQDAEGTAFSASTFLTNWNKMTRQAKATLFSDAQMRRDLDDIATLAAGTKQSQSLNNNSNTGAAFMGSAQGNLAVQSPGSFIFGAGAQYVTGKLMASPRFARILAKTAKMPPEKANRSLREQLGVLASREPLLAGDARTLQDALTRAANDNATSMASMARDQDAEEGK